MAKTASTTTTEANPVKQKRTMLTPAQRIEKLKAEAEALEKREQDRAKGKLKEAEARVTQLTEQRDKAQAKLDDAVTVVNSLKELAGVTEDSTTDES
jgi:hypothetical protein